MEAPRLQILILGSPEITWDGKPVEISRRMIRLLFYYIASQTDRLIAVIYASSSGREAG